MTANPALTGRALLARYERAWLRPDVVAGVTVAAYLVPQVMAYAQLAGLDPVVGLWSAILPGIVYALVGTSRHVSTGPESTTAIMVAVAVAPLAAGDPVRYAALSTALALLVGAICIAGGALRLGFLGDLLSHPILVGYMTGVAALMVVSQLERVTGVPVHGDSFPAQIVEFVSDLGAIHGPTFGLALGVIAFLFAARRWLPSLPGPLMAVIGATVLVAALGLDTQGIAVVGPIPSGLPPIGIPAVALADVASLAASALGIALVAYTDDILTARSFAIRNGYPIDANAELLALGGANLAAGLTSGMPVSSSGSRTAIGDSVGGRSQLAGIVASVCVVLVLLLLGNLLARFPAAALGGLVVYAALRLIDIAGFRRLARFRPSELGLAVAATAGVLVVGVLAGILVAIALSVIDLFARVARPQAAILGRAPGVAGLHNIEDYPEAVTIPGLVVFRYDAPLCFANANDFKTRALEAVESQAVRVEWLLLNAEAIVEIDLTSADALGELHDELERRGILLALARVKQDLRVQLERIGLVTHIGPDRLFATLPVALEAFERRGEESA
ncbi:MAG TPA: sulfate permease [Candidatus Limnocylindrales bacterium]|nr:sulfate permease [Candidatus Limnocylindrales bacterium]